MSLEEHKRHTFDAYCKHIIKNEAASIHREYQYQSAEEVVFSELTEKEKQQLQCTDRYAPDRRVFLLLGMEIEVLDSDLARALSLLTPERRAIVILSYLLDMTDLDIAHLFKLNRTTVRYQRKRTLAQLRKIMEEFEDEQTESQT